MINSRKLEDLDADTEAKARVFLDECRKQGIKMMITSTFRDKESQDSIFAQGRTKPGMKVTNCPGGNSMHQYRCAFDTLPLTQDGKEDWNNIAAYKRMGDIGRALGLEWGGDWKGFVDMPHFQNTKGMTLSDFKRKYPNGEAPPRQRRESDQTINQAFANVPKELPVVSVDPVVVKAPAPALVKPEVVSVPEAPKKSLLDVLKGIFK